MERDLRSVSQHQGEGDGRVKVRVLPQVHEVHGSYRGLGLG
jgi:hypothetical protein